jgi:hypothetical protein
VHLGSDDLLASEFMTPTKLNKAKKLLNRALAEGCVPKVEGNWVVFTPPLGVKLLMELLECDDAALTQAARELSGGAS